MKIQTRTCSLYKPMDTFIIEGKKRVAEDSFDRLYTFKDSSSFPSSKCSNPDIISPSELEERENPNPSIQSLFLDAFAQSEETPKKNIENLYQQQEILTESLVEAKKKIIELHKNSVAPTLLQPTIDIALPLCISVIALYLGFSPDDYLSKAGGIFTSVIGFAIAGLQMASIEIPSIIRHGYIAAFNLYMAYTNPTHAFTTITTFLQTLPILSNFFYTIDNNSLRKEEALVQNVIKKIDRDLKKVTVEISRAMKMIEQRGKFFSMTTNYTQLQNHIGGIGAT